MLPWSAALVLCDITSDSLLYCVVRMQLYFFTLPNSNDVTFAQQYVFAQALPSQ